MKQVVLLCALCICSSYGAQLNSYLSPRRGAGLITGPTYSGAALYTAGYAPAAPVIPILSYENNPNKGDGTYSYSYLTGNAIAAQESGLVGSHKSGTEAEGSYSYTGPDGQKYTVTYTAGANGFVPQGAHLPKPPPIPQDILKSIAFNAANPHSERSMDDYGSFSKAQSSYGVSSSSYVDGTSPTTSGELQHKK